MKRLVLAILAVLSLAVGVDAQTFRGTINGTVTDPSGAVVSAAKITVEYPATGLSRTATTNGSGLFLVVGLPVGHVVVDALKDGFRPVHTETDLNVGETQTLDFPLEIATVGSSVDVISEADLVKDSAAIGATFNNTQISQLPINGRNWGGLMTLTPAGRTLLASAVPIWAHTHGTVEGLLPGADPDRFRRDLQAMMS